MDYNVRISNLRMIMGNIKEMNTDAVQENDNHDALIDFLFEPAKNNELLDSFIKT